MRKMRILRPKSAIAEVLGLLLGSVLAASMVMAAAPEWNPMRSLPVEIGPQADRLVVGFRATSGNSVTRVIRSHAKAQSTTITQAQTSETDVVSLSTRTGLAVSRSRQLTPSMHVVFLQKTLFGGDVATALARLRSDILLGRMGSPEDVAWAVCYLATPASAWLTGSVIALDGGQSLS